jgi:hypothetical protein
MRLTWRRSGRAEDRFETWLAQQHRKRVLESGVTAPGPCPEEAFLRDLARKTNRISLTDPKVDHAASCPKCIKRLLALRKEIHSRRQKLVFAFAAVTCLVVVVALMFMIRGRVHERSSEAKMAVVSETVNLWDAGTLRGQQPSPLQSVSLPATLVRVKIVLPRFSGPGQYEVAVTRDQAANDVQAHDTVTAMSNSGREEVSVDLDLRKVGAGPYFLSTTHEQDQASYYYPLQVKSATFQRRQFPFSGPLAWTGPHILTIC